MNKPNQIFLTISLILFFSLTAMATEEQNNLSVSIVIKTKSEAEGIKALIDFARESNGYVFKISQGSSQSARKSITIHLPKEISEAKILEKLLSLGYIAQRSINRMNFSERIALARVQAEVKQKHIEQLTELLFDTSFKQAIEIEKSLITELAEMERLKGELNYLLENASKSIISVDFELIAVSGKPKSASIDWVNQLSIPKFNEDFQP